MYYENLEYSMLRFLIPELVWLMIFKLSLEYDELFWAWIIFFILRIIVFRKCAKKSVHRMLVSKTAKNNCSIKESQKFSYRIIRIIFAFFISLLLLKMVFFNSYGRCGDPECTEFHYDEFIVDLTCMHIFLSATIYLISMLYYAKGSECVSDDEIKEYNKKKKIGKIYRLIRGIIYVVIICILLIIYLKKLSIDKQKEYEDKIESLPVDVNIIVTNPEYWVDEYEYEWLFFYNKNGTFIADRYPPEDSFSSCQIPKGSAKFVYTAFDKPEDGMRSLPTLKDNEQYIIKIDYKTKTIEVYTEKKEKYSTKPQLQSNS